MAIVGYFMQLKEHEYPKCAPEDTECFITVCGDFVYYLKPSR